MTRSLARARQTGDQGAAAARRKEKAHGASRAFSLDPRAWAMASAQRAVSFARSASYPTMRS